MDVEGTDSRERGDEMAVRSFLLSVTIFNHSSPAFLFHILQSFERKTSLFSLVLAEILLINLWASGAYHCAPPPKMS